MSRRANAAIGPFLILLLLAGLAGCTGGAKEGVLRLGYFPNLTHAQPLYGVSTGLYQQHLGETRLETTTFNAGPSAFEALLSGRVDVIYVGPSPTISALAQTGMGVVVIVSGSASGGASFVVREGVDVEGDLGGKRFATPQLGNTQDVALKHYLLDHGHKTTDRGGDVDVVNAGNPNILAMFIEGQVDGAWLPEPWATRLVLEGGGHVAVRESDLWPEGQFVTVHMVTTRSFLRDRPDDVRNLLAAHAEATEQVTAGGPEVLAAVNDGIRMATGKRLGQETLAAAFPNISFTLDALPATFRRQYEMSHDLGFTDNPPRGDLEAVYDLSLLPAPDAMASA